jgi:threonine/homoserine/homoserine lactone efflux protein
VNGLIGDAMDLAPLLLFAGVYFAAVASPGPGLAAVVARGLGQGLAAGPAFVAGLCGRRPDLVHDRCDGTWHAGKKLRDAVSGHQVCRLRLPALHGLADLDGTREGSTDRGRHNEGARMAILLRRLSLTLGNPKVIVFFLSIMPLVIDPKAITPLVFVEMAIVIVLVITPVMAGALVLADRARRVFTSETALRRINRATAGVMAGAAALIAARG